MSERKENQKQQSSKQQTPSKKHEDREGMAQGADAADPSSLKKEIDFDGQKPNQQKKAG